MPTDRVGGKDLPSFVDDQEILARYCYSSRDFNKSGDTVRAKAFLPPTDLELSVTRHGRLSDSEIWAIGEDIALERRQPLHGRADLSASATRAASQDAVLDVLSAPIGNNLNHAHIVGWPSEKSKRKLASLALANASAPYLKPNS